MFRVTASCDVWEQMEEMTFLSAQGIDVCFCNILESLIRNSELSHFPNGRNADPEELRDLLNFGILIFIT